jgi:hypothetical protein
VIDSVALVWGHDEPYWLDWTEVTERLGSPKGEVTTKRYGEHERQYGHWQRGDVDVMVRGDGAKVELRASLPKLQTGDNTALLGAAGVHNGLSEMARRGGEILGCELDLAAAKPTRLDYVFQWEVPSVAAVLDELQTSFAPARKRMSADRSRSAAAGRSLYYGKGGRHVLRFYDKRAEVAEREIRSIGHGLRADDLDRVHDLVGKTMVRSARREARERFLRDEAGLDTLLRYEVQDRRKSSIRAIHASGYDPELVRSELLRPLEPLIALRIRDVEELLTEAKHSPWPHAVRDALAALHLGEHPELWPLMRRLEHRNTYARWRRKARRVAPRTWAPAIPERAFGPPTSLWDSGLEAAA